VTRPPVAPAATSTPAPSPQSTPVTAPEPPLAAQTLAEAPSYAVAVASFRSDARAAEVVRSLKVLELPAYVQASADGWHAVFVGPFASRDEARDAQTQVARVHLTESHIVATAPSSEGSPTQALRPVATTGQKGQP